MAKDNTDFLKFSAYSIKDLITRKLSQSTKFTDQVYEGSNLAILIDIFSHMAQCLLYSLNNTAGESMFSDTQLYENMNRLIKFIGYNPKGYAPSTAEFVLDTSTIADIENQQKTTFYKYSAIDTGKTDSRGQRIYYSTVDDVQLNSNAEFVQLFYNGIWRLHSDIYTSDGTSYQKFVLKGVKSSSEEKMYVADKMVHVYVDEKGEGKPEDFKQYMTVDEGIFTDNNIDNGSYIYKADQRICNVRLNESKTYELTFGNGFTGYKPPPSAKIYVMYLDTNGPDAELEPQDVKDVVAVHSRSLFGMSEALYNGIFKITDGVDDQTGTIATALYQSATWSNVKSSSIASYEETVDEIRRNAPEWFKTGNRLVTTSDYEYYIRNRFRDNIVDVKCQNNWQYISTFYQWLYNLGKNGARTNANKQNEQGYRAPSNNYYVNEHRLQKHDLKYADASDGNNVYLWMKMRNDSDLYKDIIDEEILNIKTLTQEAVYLKPLDVYFAPCAADKDDALQYIIGGNKPFDENHESYIEVTLNDNAIYSNNDILKQVATTIRQFFNESNFRLGQTVDYAELANKILNISNVDRLRTIWRNPEGQTRIIHGLSFATWTMDVIDVGDDMNVSSMSRTLEPFQFPVLYNSNDIASCIKVIRKSVSNINAIQY